MSMKDLVAKYKFPLFLSGVIILAIIMVGISMKMYYISGAFQLDLSRPEYAPVRDRINPAPKQQDDFSGQGEVTVQTLDEFLSMYRPEAQKVVEGSGFAEADISDEQLGLAEAAN